MGCFWQSNCIAMMYQNNSNHKNSLEVGTQFQDFVVEQLHYELGINVSIYQSKKYQFEKGESLQRIEIKYDSRSTGDSTHGECTATGNVGIEVAEKTNAQNYNFVPSGIFRRDNTFLYIVGNYDVLWIFAKKQLIKIYNENKYPIRTTLPTIQTMLIPVEDADEICIHKLVFNKKKMIPIQVKLF